MIYSHKHNFLYIAVAKTATSLIEGYISSNFHQSSFQSIFRASDGSNKLHKHSKHIDVLNKIPECKKFWSFAFVRNPYDRVVSWFSYLTQGLNDIKVQKEHLKIYGADYLSGDFQDFCKNAPDFVFNNQFFHLCDKNNNISIDFVGRYENLQSDFDLVCEKLNISKSKLPTRNKSKHKYYTEYYNDETKEIVANKYAKDIEYFGYEFGK